jgi:hypothetical protein
MRPRKSFEETGMAPDVIHHPAYFIAKQVYSSFG